MAFLIIGPDEQARIDKAVAHAKAHPIPFSVLRHAIVEDKHLVKLEDRKPGFERPESEHVILPGGYRVAFSYEEQPAGFCSHLSVSVLRREKGKMPSKEAVEMIAKAYGVRWPPDKAWVEEFDPGEFAINLLTLEVPAKEGHA